MNIYCGVPSAVAARFGYASLPLVTAIVLVAAVLVSLPLMRRGGPTRAG